MALVYRAQCLARSPYRRNHTGLEGVSIMSFYAKVKATAKRSLLKRLFPNYRGRTIILVDGESAPISDYWDEGSRAYPRLIFLRTGIDADLNRLMTQQIQGNPYGARMGNVPLVPGMGLIEHVYSGTRQYLRVTLHPDEDKAEWIG